MQKPMKLAVLAIVALFSAASAHAQYNISQNQSYTSNFGYNWGQPGATYGGGEQQILDVQLGGSGDAFLGCSGFNFNSMVQNAIQALDMENISDMMMNYMQANLAQYLLTQIYRSPQLGAIFDSLEALGQARASMLQARCDVNLAKDAGRELAIKDCMKAHPDDQAAQEKCLNPTTLSTYVNKVKDYLGVKGTLHDFIRSEKAGICSPATPEDPTGENVVETMDECPLLLFIPNIKFCTMEDCDKDDVGESDATIPPAVLNNTTTAMSNAYGIRDVMAYAKANELFHAKVDAQSNEFERVNMRARFTKIIYDSILGTAEPDAKVADLSEPEQEFLDYIGCTDVSTELSSVRYMREQLKTEFNITLPATKAIAEGYEKALSGTDVAESLKVLKGATDAEGKELDLPAASKMMDLAVRCVRNHNFALQVEDQAKMLKHLDKRDAQIVHAGVSAKTGFMASMYVLAYIEDKLIGVLATRSNVDGSDAGVTKDRPQEDDDGNLSNDHISGDSYTQLPKHIEDRLQYTIKRIQNQRQILERQFEQSNDFARAVSLIENIDLPIKQTLFTK